MKTTTGVIALAAAMLAAYPAAHALVLCTTPDGKTYAGDTPPPDCKIKSQYVNAPAESPSPQDALDAAEANRKAADANAIETQALASRRRIETDANRAAEELDDIHAKLANVPQVNAGGYQSNVSGVRAYHQDATARSEAVTAMRARERELLSQIKDCRTRFDELTSSLAKAPGSLPASWSRTMRCDRCP